ncbi:hypothetical protein BDP27DRAFT_1425961 [Rhodocollybia butyracea]|uniref:Uncharacterized protein n=1 Tax=Rhodocollybia butyracea TaxID=206335 RepID=A0A9P5PLN7_9AGAR|nr:hypothetical protein BDP27DRAFT_1425961 [Rhodocollybia butyracea]
MRRASSLFVFVHGSRHGGVDSEYEEVSLARKSEITTEPSSASRSHSEGGSFSGRVMGIPSTPCGTPRRGYLDITFGVSEVTLASSSPTAFPAPLKFDTGSHESIGAIQVIALELGLDLNLPYSHGQDVSRKMKFSCHDPMFSEGFWQEIALTFQVSHFERRNLGISNRPQLYKSLMRIPVIPSTPKPAGTSRTPDVSQLRFSEPLATQIVPRRAARIPE